MNKYIINSYKYYSSNNGLLEECDKEENLEVTVGGTATAYCSEKKFVEYFVQCHVFGQSPPGRRPIGKYPVNASHRSRFV